MNTSALKKFAQAARNVLLDDVSKRFLYWGFDKTGKVLHELEATSGGYLFRGDAHNDTSIPAKWNALVSAVGQHTVNDIIEEAAYTWFNRLMAIKILEQNGYDQPMLAYAAADLQEPVILRNAKKGIYPTSNPQEIQALKRKLTGANDDEALATLLVSYCRNHQLLNRIFGHLDDYTELLIPGALMAKGSILELINDDSLILEAEYQEVELIGWLYQFYISDKKDDVFAGFKKKKKARAEDIPAATQIFTPKWIVKYLVENTVGRLWLDLHPDSPIRETMKYLVEPENPTKDEPIIKDVTELKVLDPAVGSGHFLVVAFDLLMQMYQEEGYSNRKAVASIIKHNLYGLDICPRAVGLANFAILLKAAQYRGDILREAHFPKVFAMPEPFDFTSQQVESFLDTNDTTIIDEVHTAFKLLKQGQNIGSALILDLSETSKEKLLAALNSSRSKSLDLSDQMASIRIRPFAEVASILTDHFPAVVANPPYMSSKNMNADLANFLKTHYPRSKADLFAVFMEVCTSRNPKAGFMGMINQHSWMFLSSYERLRTFTLNNFTLKSMLHLGPRLFDELSGEVVQSTAFVQKRFAGGNYRGDYFRLIEYKSNQSKHEQFLERSHHFNRVVQSDFSKIPGNPVAYWAGKRMISIFENEKSLKELAPPRVGLQTGENTLFIRQWPEISFKTIGLNFDLNQAISSRKKWFPYNNGGSFRKWYGNNNDLVDWENDGQRIKEDKLHKLSIGECLPSNSKPKNMQFYFHESITWSFVSSTNFGVRYSPKGKIFDIAGSSVFANGDIIFYLTGLLNTKLTHAFLSVLNPTLNFQAGNVAKIPTIIDSGQKTLVNSLVKECISIAQEDWDSHEYSWDFKCSPLLSQALSLSDSMKIYIEKIAESFFQMYTNEMELNRIFIEIYGLQTELTSHVNLDDITLLAEELDREMLMGSNQKSYLKKKELPIKKDEVVEQFLSYSVGCFMGRYRLDKPALNIAHPNPSPEELSPYIHNEYKFEIDDDAIIPMMGSESPFSDDIVQRAQQFVLMVWGENSYTENLNFINEALGEHLEKFLTKKFWAFHKKMYKKRPIYWQFASTKGAFKVLTYMHRMNRFTVQKIRKNYLLKQINYLQSEIDRLSAKEASLNATETRRLDRFRSDLVECKDYDLILKDVADKQIEFDLDDGVVENYKLFEGVVSKI